MLPRGRNDLKQTAVFIGGADMAAGGQDLGAATERMFKPFTVSVMLDSNGSNPTAVAAVAKLLGAVPDLRGQRVVVVAGTGPVGQRAAGLFAKAGADVVITSRKQDAGDRARDLVRQRFGGQVRCVCAIGPADAAGAPEGAALLLNAGPAGVLPLPPAPPPTP